VVDSRARRHRVACGPPGGGPQATRRCGLPRGLPSSAARRFGHQPELGQLARGPGSGSDAHRIDVWLTDRPGCECRNAHETTDSRGAGIGDTIVAVPVTSRWPFTRAEHGWLGVTPHSLTGWQTRRPGSRTATWRARGGPPTLVTAPVQSPGRPPTTAPAPRSATASALRPPLPRSAALVGPPRGPPSARSTTERRCCSPGTTHGGGCLAGRHAGVPVHFPVVRDHRTAVPPVIFTLATPL
jgi:hypothetical protein